MADINVRTEPGVTVLELADRLDISVLDELRPQLLAAARDAEERMVIRMGAVTFLDSTGLGALVAIQKLLHQQGKQLLLAEVPAQARMVLRITHLEWLLPCYETYDEALAA